MNKEGIKLYKAKASSVKKIHNIINKKEFKDSLEHFSRYKDYERDKRNK